MIVVLVCLFVGLILTGIASWLVEMSCKIEQKSKSAHKYTHRKSA